MGNKRLTPHPSPLPQVEGAVHCSQFTNIPMDCRENQRFSRNDWTIQPFNHSTIQLVKAKAFTLAETLIVIGIIGVVAALTLPNLNHATGDKEKVTRVKKIYSSLTEAFDRAEAVYGSFEEWFNDLDCYNRDWDACGERTGQRIFEFMKLSKDCAATEDMSCTGYDNKNYYKVITADGMSIGIAYNDVDVDIDGLNKGSHKEGVDYFRFNIDEKLGIIPYGMNKVLTFDKLMLDLSGRRGYAAYWILTYDNADYLKLIDENGTCQNGNVMTESNPSCN